MASESDLQLLDQHWRAIQHEIEKWRARMIDQHMHDRTQEWWADQVRLARDQERAAVVAWLRKEIQKCGCDDDTASCIERGEHRREKP